MTAGRRDTLIAFITATKSRAANGEQLETWDGAPLATEWAHIAYGTGAERRQAAQEQGQQAATFEVNSNAATRAITIQNRIRIGAEDWDIVGISPDVPNHGDISFTGVRAP